jgi:hypothetical protein
VHLAEQILNHHYHYNKKDWRRLLLYSELTGTYICLHIIYEVMDAIILAFEGERAKV